MARDGHSEAARVAALAAHNILDTAPEAAFDEITRLATTLFATAGATISLVDGSRQWFKSRRGIAATETPRSQAFCAHAVDERLLIEVPDATRDPRFASNALVTKEGGIRFYAGAPMTDATGHVIGTLCVFDPVPRPPMSPAQRRALQDLADLAMERIETRALRVRAEIAASVVATTSDAVLAVGRDGLIAFWNTGAERMFGHAVQDALGHTLDLILPPHLAHLHHRGFARANAGGATSLVGTTVEVSARRASGEEFPVELSLAHWNGTPGQDGGGFAAIMRDVSSRQALERDRNDARLFLDSIVAHLPAMLFVKDGTSRAYVLLNKAGEDIVGLPAAAVIGRTDQTLFPNVGDDYNERDTRALGSAGVETYESDFTRHDGRIVTLRTKRIVVQAEGSERPYILGLSEDVTELRKTERRMLHMAHHDSLTGLHNRSTFVERLEAMVADRRPLAVLTIDLDRFKAVNDQFGHPVGDRLLVEAAERLRAVAGPDDLVARIGGDEFAILAIDGDRARAREIATATLTALGRPYAIGRFVAHAGASIGVVVSPSDGDTVEALRQAADLALYRAKMHGRNTVCFFDAQMESEATARRALERDLRLAVDRDEITVHYQPIVSASTGQVTSFEALARWTHPTHGSVGPTCFIAIAEECGLIARLGECVLRQACRAAAAWPAHIRVAVNLSPMQFESDVVTTVRAALVESGLSPHRLQLEVTESLVIRNVEHSFAVLTELRSIGVQILLDDFGVGFSSLSYFERFPFDKVKIDQSFVRKMGTTPAAVAIIQAVVGLGRALTMGIVAEGVEDEEQMRALVALGCTHMQGYLFSPPRSEAAFAHVLGDPSVAPWRTDMKIGHAA